ncbi:response regulator, partial [uncultured Amnibacterium sp.]|uniref:response regulator transcription factor n=1 Tax=uncultured Amnibacterium sp. TaxID=1631851 RepID=UPI0035CAF8C6
MPVRLVLADDRAMIRSGLALVLSSAPDIEVVGQFADGSDLIRGAASLRPDVVLTDIRMPVLDGIEATRRIRAVPDAPPILALTTFDDDDVLWPALAAGVGGFVLKDSPAEALISAVRAVAAGGAWLDPRVLPRVLERAVAGSGAASADRGALARLTPREREVLDRVCLGATNAEIAARLHASERTVK